MGVFDLDFSRLRAVVEPDRIPLHGNEHRITRIAFDLFKLDEDKENLWQVQADDDGNEFLVRTYELPKDEGLQAKSEWSVLEDGRKASLTVAYRGMPIHRMVAADYGAHSPDDVRLLRDLIQAKLASAEFASRMLATLSEPKRAALMAMFPKLATGPIPKIPLPTGNDPLEGLPPLDVKKEFGIDVTQKPQPLSKEWERHPRTPGSMTADDDEPKGSDQVELAMSDVENLGGEMDRALGKLAEALSIHMIVETGPFSEKVRRISEKMAALVAEAQDVVNNYRKKGW